MGDMDKIEETKDNEKAKSVSPQCGFVSCLSCHYCDCVSFDESDEEAYKAHLINEHGIVRNIDSLMKLTLEQQKNVSSSPPPPPSVVIAPPVFNLPITEMTDDWMEDDVGIVDDESDEEKIKVTELKEETVLVETLSREKTVEEVRENSVLVEDKTVNESVVEVNSNDNFPETDETKNSVVNKDLEDTS